MNENDIRRIAQEVYTQNESRSRFNLTPINNHVHNGIDSQRIPFQNVGIPLNSATGLDVVSQNDNAPPPQKFNGPFTIYPIPIISHGVTGGFNGGTAPEGMMLLEATADALTSFLWVYAGGQWYSFACNSVI